MGSGIYSRMFHQLLAVTVLLGVSTSCGSASEPPSSGATDASAGTASDSTAEPEASQDDWYLPPPDTGTDTLVDAWTGACAPRSWKALPGHIDNWPNWSADSNLTLLPSGRVLVGFGRAEYDPATDTYDHVTKPARSRGGGTSTLLSDGKTVLFTGGGVWVSDDATELTDLYDTETHELRPGPLMHESRTWHHAALMKDGRVLVVGGMNSSDGDASPMAEIYDPATNSFIVTGDPTVTLSAATPVPLPDGRVFVVPYFIDDYGWMFDPATDVWTVKPLPTKQSRPWALLLNDGTVLVGGYRPEIYDPKTDTWRRTGPVKEGANTSPWDAAHAHLLPCGDVFLWADTGGLSQQFLYRPSTDTWFTLPNDIPNDFANHAHSLLLPDGRVIVASGTVDASPSPWLLQFGP